MSEESYSSRPWSCRLKGCHDTQQHWHAHNGLIDKINEIEAALAAEREAHANYVKRVIDPWQSRILAAEKRAEQAGAALKSKNERILELDGQVADLTERVRELQEALSGRTVSCGNCNALAASLERAREALERLGKFNGADNPEAMLEIRAEYARRVLASLPPPTSTPAKEPKP